MISRTIRFLAKALAIFVLIVAVLLMIFRFSPQTVLHVANLYSPFEVVAERVDTEFLPLTFRFRNIRISETQQQQLAHLQGLTLSADWMGAIKGRHNFWDIALSDGVVDLRKLPESESTATAGPQENIERSPKLDLHRLISALSARVNNVKLIVNDEAYVHLQKIESSSSEVGEANPSDVIQNIDMQFVYTLNEMPLVVDAKMESLQNAGFTDIKLSLSTIDLSPLAQSANNASAITANSAANNLILEESEMDWAWLDMIDATRITFSVDKLNYPGIDAGGIVSKIIFNEDISFDVSTHLKIDISDSLKFDDTLSLIGKLTPIDKFTIGADLAGDVQLKTPKLDFRTQGRFNLNGQFENNLNVLLSASSMPFETIPVASSNSLIDTLFPVNAQFNLQGSSPEIDLSKIDIKMGESDFNGTLNLIFSETKPVRIEGEFNSQKLVFKPTAVVQEEGAPEAKESAQKSNVFDGNIIDWSWLENKELDLIVSVAELDYSKYQLLNLHLPIALHEGQLNITDLKAVFAGGAWTSSLSLQNLEEGVALSIESDLSNATLEAMNLIPSEQITEGETNLSTRLVSKGASSKQLVEALEGDLLLDIRDGRITNDYFEIIGSDLFSELLTKLNPFVKSDPTTELKCMVANLKFDQGEIQVDKSIALATSKISVVADGKIDLANEKIKLKIVPRTENGIGLGIGTLVKSVSLGGSLSNPVPHVTAGDLLKSGLALGVALTTGGTSLLADGVLNKAVGANACKRAEKAFTDEAAEIDAIERAEQLERQKLIEQQELLESSIETPTN